MLELRICNSVHCSSAFCSKQQEQDEAARRAAEEVRAAELWQQEKLKLSREVPPEPAKEDEGAIQVALRLPSGKRIDRRFLQSHSMKVFRLRAITLHKYIHTFNRSMLIGRDMECCAMRD